MHPRSALALCSLAGAVACTKVGGEGTDTARPTQPHLRHGRASGASPAAESTRGDPPPARPRASGGEADRTQADLLAAHNRVRASVGVRPLAWSDAIARFAQRRADHLAARGCKLVHDARNAYGENLFWTSRSVAAATVVATWAEERHDYDDESNTCPGGTCGHYTQVIWAASTHLGCGMASCGSAEIWVCNYDPPGNVVGRAPY